MILQHNDLTHDIFLDELLRGGIVGMSLMVVAFVITVLTGLRAAWVRHSPRITAMGLAASAVVVELVTRGAVESVFEKERLAVVIGLAVGIACAAARPVGTQRRRRPRRDEPLTVPDAWLPSDPNIVAGTGRLVAAGPIPRQVDN
jgi:O-antigen ligase